LSAAICMPAFSTRVLSMQILEPGQKILPREGLSSFLWKLSRIGERLSPYIGASCAIMSIHVIFFKK
jgi:hypothetical protein